MYRITNREAVARIQTIIIEQGAVPLPDDAGLIVMTPAVFAQCIEAAREGAKAAALDVLVGGAVN